MKIVHACLSNFYIDGLTYQENELVRQHVKTGNEVSVITSVETFGDGQQLTYVEPCQYIGSEGERVTRLAYRPAAPRAIAAKLRMHGSAVYRLLEEENPDVIVFHGLCGWELLTVCKYKRRHPRVKLVVDSHEDYFNSARSLASKMLHYFYYRPIIRRCAATMGTVLCISRDTIEFVHTRYGLPRKSLEFFPLGGRLLPDDEYASRRSRARQHYQLGDDQILMVITGKLSARKQVVETLECFSQVSDARFKVVLAGSMPEDTEPGITDCIRRDDRVEFVGWKSADELGDLLCAADVYLQPGSQSATMQMSLCARCPVILADVLSHEPFVSGNGWLVKDAGGLLDAFQDISNAPEALEAMSTKSHEIARRLLDYNRLAERLLC